METVVTFKLPDPLAAERSKFLYAVGAVARMIALDCTKGDTERQQEIAVALANEVAVGVMGVIDGQCGRRGYYLMPHNEDSKLLPNLSGSLAEQYMGLFDDIDS